MNQNTPHKLIRNATMAQTIAAMKRLALEGRSSLRIRSLVEQITLPLASGDYTSEVLAIYYWVCQNVRYIRDPDNVEMVKTADKILETRTGDCDDMAILLASLCMAAGNPCDFVLAGFAPGSLSHVYCAVRTPFGLMVLDPVANRVTGEMLSDMKSFRVERITQGAGTVDAGIGQPSHIGAAGGNLYSVFDYHRQVFDYYEGPSKPLPATGKYRAPTKKQSLGIVPEAFAAPLPAGARKVGEGKEARGVVATTGLNAPVRVNKDLIMGLALGATAVVLWYRRKS